MMNIEQEDPVIEYQVEENSIIGSEAAHLKYEDKGEEDLIIRGTSWYQISTKHIRWI